MTAIEDCGTVAAFYNDLNGEQLAEKVAAAAQLGMFVVVTGRPRRDFSDYRGSERFQYYLELRTMTREAVAMAYEAYDKQRIANA